MTKPKIGTCSWNYDSWVGLVYTQKCRTAAQYLREYSDKYNTVEIDSWFYRMPSPKVVRDYADQVNPNFRFTIKIPRAISLTHQRNRGNTKKLITNPTFLSTPLFTEFLQAIEPITELTDALILQFEYLNRAKMPSLGHFLSALDTFLNSVPRDIPLAIETRNKNYLTREYFRFLQTRQIMHVFSEKLYMPPIYEVYAKFGELLTDKTVIRLLGGDRQSIENKTEKQWNTIVAPKTDLIYIAEMAKDMLARGIDVTINVNNHYEGSAPLTIEKLLPLL